MKELEDSLKKYGLRKTNFRINLIDLFKKSASSLTADEIRKHTSKKTDKATIYRALESFEKKGLIHRVPDKSNLNRYALCHEECAPTKHDHNHAHFICNHCLKTFCIQAVKIPEIESMKGFQVKKSKLILEGKCANCEK